MRFKQRIERQDRELDSIRQASEGNSTHLYNRISVLEQEIEDLKIERDTARLSAQNNVSRQSTGTSSSRLHSKEEDLESIESNMNKLIASGGAGDEALFKAFERYKSKVGIEMTDMRKKMSMLRQGEDNIKGLELELKKKDEKIKILLKKIEELEDKKAQRDQNSESYGRMVLTRR